ncbi:MAG: mechanosensitive ion channel family protein [Rhodothermales bacterium]|nr:mechanosensitive ion channel family protein [Rhodothermales bacterium]
MMMYQDQVAAVDSTVVPATSETTSTLNTVADPVNSIGEKLAELLGLPEYGSNMLVVVVTIILIFTLAWIIIKFVDRATRTWEKRYSESEITDPARQRATTLSNLFSSAIRYVAWPMATIMALSEFGLDVGALIATAGIAGLAVGFGAQTLVKDVISGIFLLFDDSIHIGDLITVGNDTGTVEFIGVRLIKVRKFNGELLMVPAGELRTFGNNSIGFARAIINIGVAYEQNLEEILPAVQEIANTWVKENEEIMLEPEPTVQAVTSLGASQVDIRVVIKVVPGQQFELERRLRRAIKKEFDARGIEIPFPRQTIYLKKDA